MSVDRFPSNVGSTLPANVGFSLTRTIFVTVSTLRIFRVHHAPSCTPACTRFTLPKGATSPMSVTSLCNVFAPTRMSQDRFGVLTGIARTPTSNPRFTIEPMFTNGFCENPSDGGSGCCRIRSLLTLWK